MSTTLRPHAIETRDLARIRQHVGDLYVRLGVLELAAEGRCPWGFLTPREKRAWYADLERACELVNDTRLSVLSAARTVIAEEAS